MTDPARLGPPPEEADESIWLSLVGLTGSDPEGAAGLPYAVRAWRIGTGTLVALAAVIAGLSLLVLLRTVGADAPLWWIWQPLAAAGGVVVAANLLRMTVLVCATGEPRSVTVALAIAAVIALPVAAPLHLALFRRDAEAWVTESAAVPGHVAAAMAPLVTRRAQLDSMVSQLEQEQLRLTRAEGLWRARADSEMVAQADCAASCRAARAAADSLRAERATINSQAATVSLQRDLAALRIQEAGDSVRTTTARRSAGFLHLTRELREHEPASAVIVTILVVALFLAPGAMTLVTPSLRNDPGTRERTTTDHERHT